MFTGGALNSHLNQTFSGTFDGDFCLNDGTVGAPSLKFINEPTTGLYLFDPGTTDGIGFTSHLVPSMDGTYDLGTSTNSIRTLYLNNSGGEAVVFAGAAGTGSHTDYTFNVGGGGTGLTEGGTFTLKFEDIGGFGVAPTNNLVIDLGLQAASATNSLVIRTGILAGEATFTIQSTTGIISFQADNTIPLALPVQFSNTKGDVRFIPRIEAGEPYGQVFVGNQGTALRGSGLLTFDPLDGRAFNTAASWAISSLINTRGPGIPAGTMLITNAKTHVVGIHMEDLKLSLSGGSVTNTAQIYIEEVMTEGTNNYAILVDTGVTRLDGQIQAGDGTLSVPSYSFSSDTDSGRYWKASGNYADVVNGIEAMEFMEDSGATYGNIGMGGAASSSNQIPLAIARDQNDNTLVTIQNANGGASSFSGVQCRVDSGGLEGIQVFANPVAGVIQAYADYGIVRSLPNSKGLSIFANASGGLIDFFIGSTGTYASDWVASYTSTELIQKRILTTESGRRKNITRVTSGPYSTLTTDETIFVDTDSAAITVNLIAGVQGQKYRIVNVGSSANDVTVSPDGSELLLGANSDFTLGDGEALIIAYDSTEGWF
jgi:hypothetical protein